MFAVVSVVFAAVFLAGCGSEVGEGDANGFSGDVTRIGFSEEVTNLGETGVPEIVVASDMAYPPFSFAPRKGPKGFDIALMDEIARRVGFEVEYKDASFDFITRGLTGGIYDASISAMTITETRMGQADFSEPYYVVSEGLVVGAGSEIESTGDLQDATLGVQRGTPGMAEAGDLLGAGDVERVRIFRTVDEAFVALERGLIDGVIYDLPAAQQTVDESDGALELVEVIPTDSRYGIAFPKGSPLVGPVNEALSDIKEDGTYEELYEEWIGRPPEQMP
ncbi:MAG: ABC transporter substrate-binding protein [Actinomycetota bacterium]|nr:ABC transporter substrate-binding protein [Actinomycetota bacterium]